MTTFFDRSMNEEVELSDTAFNPETASYAGSAYQYARKNPQTGESKLNSRAVANMLGQNAAKDASMKIPTGATTDFKQPAKSNHPSMQGKSRYLHFKPNAHENQEGAWN